MATPLESLIQEAKNGGLSVSFNTDVRVNADEFVYMERDCEAFLDAIEDMQAQAKNIAKREKWGLGESTPGLTSASTLVGWFRGKANKVGGATDSDNNVNDILQQHHSIVVDIRDLHREIAKRYIAQDQEFAARYNELSANVPPSAIGSTEAKA
ncbi:hypothetical protein [Nocardia salmonicida]|uniref:hypothetical protein n=1 Tax=Nocardia salmonicida TaxID=53431 RepID=UPI000A0375EF|nr:hypothetical protein [Nocardia salmonicida]